MEWEEGKKAPVRMVGGTAVVHGNTIYFAPFNTINQSVLIPEYSREQTVV